MAQLQLQPLFNRPRETQTQRTCEGSGVKRVEKTVVVGRAGRRRGRAKEEERRGEDSSAGARQRVATISHHPHPPTTQTAEYEPVPYYVGRFSASATLGLMPAPRASCGGATTNQEEKRGAMLRATAGLKVPSPRCAGTWP